jgi:succinate-semialdehyde dehydrogenase/glutarate-semialdehyde dehydrogenase
LAVPGDLFDESTTLALLSSQTAADEIREKVSEAVKHGAKALVLGRTVSEKGAFVQPTILSDITPTIRPTTRGSLVW